MKPFFQICTHLILIHLFVLNSFAQNTSIKGVVYDKENNEPIGYASIYLKGKSIGTISNLQGNFNFIFPNSDNNDTLIISCIGYNQIKNCTNYFEAQPSPCKIYLEKNQSFLQEVVISEKRTDIREIVNTALKKIKTNYHQDPAILDGYYKEYITETVNSNANNRSIDAAVKIYDTGYNKIASKLNQDDIVKIIGIRKLKTDDFRYQSTSVFQTNFFSMLLKENPLKYSTNFFNEKKNDKYIFNLEKIIVEDTNKIYVISFYPPDSNVTLFSPKGYIYLLKNNYSILKVVFSKPEQENSTNGSTFMGINFQWNYKEVEVYFKKIDNYLYLSYIKHNFKVTLIDQKESTNYSLKIATELLINNYEINSVYKPEEPNIMKFNTDLFNQNIDYNKEFWDNYNIIQE